MLAIATGKEQLDRLLSTHIENTQIVGYREFFLENKYETVILSNFIKGEMPLETLFFTLKQNGTRIIYLTSEEIQEEHANIALCLKYGVYDIYVDSINIANIKNLLDNPKSLQNDDIQELFVKYLNKEALEEKKVALKGLLRKKSAATESQNTEIPDDNTNTKTTVAAEATVVQEEIKQVEKIIEKIVEIEVQKTIKIKEMDTCTISVISNVRNGKSFTTWNSAKYSANSEYSTAVINTDQNFSANVFYGISDNSDVDLNSISGLKAADDIEKLGMKISDNYTVFTNSKNNKEKLISIDNFKKLLHHCKIHKDITFLDFGEDCIELIKEGIKESIRVLIIFDLDEISIEQNFKLLDDLDEYLNPDKVIAVVNYYSECEAYKRLLIELKRYGIKKVTSMHFVQGMNVYDLFGTNYVAYEKDDVLEEDIRALMSLINAREPKKKKNVSKSVLKDIKVIKKEVEDSMKPGFKFLKMILLLILAIIVIFIIAKFFLPKSWLNLIEYYIKNIIGSIKK